ncbi:MAG: TonB family protein [Hyphococcus sp.]
MEDARARRRASELPGGEYENAGAHLRAVREASGLTIAEAAGRTHIKDSHLEAIEQLDVAALPPRPYAIGFVKTYAEFLGLDADAVVGRFKEDAGYAAPQPISVEQFEAKETEAEQGPRDLSLLAVFVILVFIIWCAWQITRPHEVRMLGDAADRAASSDGPSQTSAAMRAPAPDAIPENVVEARIIERIEPVYPRRCANDARPVETVIVTFNITADGLVADERVAEATSACFENAALNALRRWRFQPRTVNGSVRPAYDQKYSFSFQRPR